MTRIFLFINQKTAEKYFEDTPEALLNTIKIADMCNVELELGKWVFPDVKVESGLSYDDEFRKIVYAGLEKRAIKKQKKSRTVLNMNLKLSWIKVTPLTFL